LDETSAFAAFLVNLLEGASSAMEAFASASFIASVVDAASGRDTPAARYLWELIEDDEPANWTDVSTDIAGGWVPINDNQATTWQNVATSSSDDWALIDDAQPTDWTST
jgi:hypothetical protein